MRKLTIVAATAPVWVVGLLLITAPNYFHALLLNPPSLVGLPFGLVIAAVAVALTIIGFIAVESESRVIRAAGIAFGTLPAVLTFLMAPAIVLILLNLPT
jgi:hypothetical protein